MLEFKSILVIVVFSIILSSVIAVASFLLSFKQPDKDKISIYECGFDPLGTPTQPFSVRFFLVGILFLVFDVEVAFIFPWSILPLTGFWVVIFFLAILTLGLVYEWLEGGLEWE